MTEGVNEEMQGTRINVVGDVLPGVEVMCLMRPGLLCINSAASGRQKITGNVIRCGKLQLQ